MEVDPNSQIAKDILMEIDDSMICFAAMFAASLASEGKSYIIEEALQGTPVDSSGLCYAMEKHELGQECRDATQSLTKLGAELERARSS